MYKCIILLIKKFNTFIVYISFKNEFKVYTILYQMRWSNEINKKFFKRRKL